jgi:predicted nucleic acid-binding protein
MRDLIVEPIDYFTTMILIDRSQWIKAMVEEYNSMLLNKMWELVALLT